MLRYKLRTLLIVLALGPPVLAAVVPPVIAWILEPPPSEPDYGSRWNGPYEYVEPGTNSLDRLPP
jgi:hypothetical protein